MVAGCSIDIENLQKVGSAKTGFPDIPPPVPEKDKTLEHKAIFHGFKREMKEIFKLSLPVAVTNLFQFFICTTSLMMNGRMSKLEMDGVALANSMIDAFGLAIGVGLCTACDTMFSQSFGSKNKRRTGMWLQKCLLVINCVAFVIAAVHLNFEPILVAIGQHPEVARIAAQYMALFAPGIFFQFNYVILARYLQTQNKIFVPVPAGFLGNLFNVVTQYVLLYQFDFGTQASSLCQVASFAIMFTTELIYILASKFYVDTWDGFKRESLTSWNELFYLALAGVGHVTLECVCWEVGTFISGILGTTELAVQSILFQTETILYTCSFGVSIAVNIRVGQNLGGNLPFTAKRAVVVGWFAGMCWAVPCGILLIAFRSTIPGFFTNHQDVITATSFILPFMALFLVIDTFHVINAGALRGTGRQKLGAAFIFVGFYIFAEPLGISLAFLTSLKVLGLWVGILFGLTTTAILEFIALYRQNWEAEADKAQQRVSCSSSSSSDPDEKSALLPKARRRKHTHTLSEPYGCSIDMTKLTPYENVSDDKFRRLVVRRIVIYCCSISFFILGLLLHFYLPEELYLQPASWNSTVISESNSTITTEVPINLS